MSKEDVKQAEGSKAMTKVVVPQTVEDAVGLPAEELAALDYTALPTIVNDGEDFKVRNGNFKLPDGEFEAVILTVTPYQYHKCNNPEHAMPGFYTFDGETTSKGERVADVHKLWEEDGCSWVEQDYLSLRVLMLAPEEAFNALCIVNISPASIKRAEAYIRLELMRQRRLKHYQAITRLKLAEKAVRGRGGKMFKPWELEFVKEFDLDEFQKQLEA